MKLSQFNELMVDEFGSQFAEVLLRDVALTDLQDQTPSQLIRAGVDPRDIWIAICKQQAVPKERWNGKLLRKQHAE